MVMVFLKECQDLYFSLVHISHPLCQGQCMTTVFNVHSNNLPEYETSIKNTIR